MHTSFIIHNDVPLVNKAIKDGYKPELREEYLRHGQTKIINFFLKKGKSITSFDELSSLLENDYVATSLVYRYKDKEDIPIKDYQKEAIRLSIDQNGSLSIDKDVEILCGKIELDFDEKKIKIDEIDGKTLFFILEDEESQLPKLNISLISEDEVNLKIISAEIFDPLGEVLNIEIDGEITIKPAIPDKSELLQSYPNPANQGCYIPFKLSADSNQLTVEIYNILGQKVKP